MTDNGPTFVARRFGAFLKDVFTHVRTRIPKWQSWARAAKAKLDPLMAEAA